MTEPELLRAASKLRATQVGIAEMSNESYVTKPQELEGEKGKKMPAWDTAPIELPEEGMVTGSDGATAAQIPGPVRLAPAPSPAPNHSFEDLQKKSRELELGHLDAEETKIRERRAQLLAAEARKE